MEQRLARQAHNLEVAGSIPVGAIQPTFRGGLFWSLLWEVINLRSPPMRCTPALAILFSLWTLTCAAFRPGVAAWDEPQPSSGPGQSLTVPGLSHLYKLDNRLYSGGTPEGIEGLESLKKLGVATIIRVDGARPDVAAIQ